MAKVCAKDLTLRIKGDVGDVKRLIGHSDSSFVSRRFKISIMCGPAPKSKKDAKRIIALTEKSIFDNAERIGDISSIFIGIGSMLRSLKHVKDVKKILDNKDLEGTLSEETQGVVWKYAKMDSGSLFLEAWLDKSGRWCAWGMGNIIYCRDLHNLMLLVTADMLGEC